MTFLCVKDNNNHLTEDFFFFWVPWSEVRLVHCFSFHCYFLKLQMDLNKTNIQKSLLLTKGLSKFLKEARNNSLKVLDAYRNLWNFRMTETLIAEMEKQRSNLEIWRSLESIWLLGCHIFFNLLYKKTLKDSRPFCIKYFLNLQRCFYYLPCFCWNDRVGCFLFCKYKAKHFNSASNTSEIMPVNACSSMFVHVGHPMKISGKYVNILQSLSFVSAFLRNLFPLPLFYTKG